jgi:hypothetical protein
VWAFKRNASPEFARADFVKLDEMFAVLNYPIGFFVNIASEHEWLEHYNGKYTDRLYGAYVWLDQHGGIHTAMRRRAGLQVV